MLGGTLRIVEFAIGHEMHPNPSVPENDEHFHIVAEFNKNLNVRRADAFDIVGLSNSHS